MTRRLTPTEMFTALIVVIVVVAIAIPMWQNRELRQRRQDAIDALRAVQTAQDDYFGQHARYADESQLREIAPRALNENASSPKGHYRLLLSKSDDDLAYRVTARALTREGETADTRCVELRIDQNGRKFAVDAAGDDRSADCWR